MILAALPPAGAQPEEPAGGGQWAVEENSAFRIETPPDRKALGPALLDLCTKARKAMLENTRVAFPYQVTVRWCDTEEEFLRNTGQRPENVVAAASARQTMIWINGPAWQRTGAQEALPILIHEYAHVVVGTLAPAPLPRWADEGLAMHLAGQWTLGDGYEASKAQLFGGLPSLASIEKDFPADGQAMRRAYLMSYMAVEHLARGMGAKPGNVDPILEHLESPAQGVEFARSLWEPMNRAGIQDTALAALGHSARKWVIYLTSGTTLWLLLVLLFLFAYWRKKRRVAQAEQREREEEPWVESLTEGDIRDIYGDPEDTVPEDDKRPWE